VPGDYRQFCLGSSPVDYLEERGLFWPDVAIHLGQLGKADNGRGTRLGSLNEESLRFWIANYTPVKVHGQWLEKKTCCSTPGFAWPSRNSTPKAGFTEKKVLPVISP
jgi:hypothetical protein